MRPGVGQRGSADSSRESETYRASDEGWSTLRRGCRLGEGLGLAGGEVRHDGLGVQGRGMVWSGAVIGVVPNCSTIRSATSVDRKSTRLNSSHYCAARMPAYACITILTARHE